MYFRWTYIIWKFTHQAAILLCFRLKKTNVYQWIVSIVNLNRCRRYAFVKRKWDWNSLKICSFYMIRRWKVLCLHRTSITTCSLNWARNIRLSRAYHGQQRLFSLLDWWNRWFCVIKISRIFKIQCKSTSIAIPCFSRTTK